MLLSKRYIATTLLSHLRTYNGRCSQCGETVKIDKMRTGCGGRFNGPKLSWGGKTGTWALTVPELPMPLCDWLPPFGCQGTVACYIIRGPNAPVGPARRITRLQPLPASEPRDRAQECIIMNQLLLIIILYYMRDALMILRLNHFSRGNSEWY